MRQTVIALRLADRLGADAGEREAAYYGRHVDRAKRLASFPGAGFKQMETFLTTHSTLGAQFAERVGFDALVSLAIGQAYEQWDGKGQPLHLRGDQICFPARVVQFAGPAETFHRRHGLHAAVAMGHRGRGPGSRLRSWTRSVRTPRRF